MTNNLPDNFSERDENWLENPDAYGYVYETTNLINGKMYIGQHSRTKFDKNYYGSGKYITKALNKYGKENFEVRLIGWGYSKEDLDESENFFIESVNTIHPNGYNLMTGHSHGKHHSETKETIRKLTKERLSNPKNHPRYGKHLTEEQKQKISQSVKGFKHTEETKQKMRESQKKFRQEHPNFYKGRKPSKETIEKIKESQLKNLNSMSEEKRKQLKLKQSIITKKRNHNYWHTRRNMFNPNCEFCIEEEIHQLKKEPSYE